MVCSRKWDLNCIALHCMESPRMQANLPSTTARNRKHLTHMVLRLEPWNKNGLHARELHAMQVGSIVTIMVPAGQGHRWCGGIARAVACAAPEIRSWPRLLSLPALLRQAAPEPVAGTDRPPGGAARPGRVQACGAGYAGFIFARPQRSPGRHH